MALYDIATIWLDALNRSITDGTNPRSGRNIFDKIKNTTFPGKTANYSNIERCFNKYIHMYKRTFDLCFK